MNDFYWKFSKRVWKTIKRRITNSFNNENINKIMISVKEHKLINIVSEQLTDKFILMISKKFAEILNREVCVTWEQINTLSDNEKLFVIVDCWLIFKILVWSDMKSFIRLKMLKLNKLSICILIMISSCLKMLIQKRFRLI